MTHTRIRKFNTKATYPDQKLDNDLCQTVVARGRMVFVRGQVGQDIDTSESVAIGDPTGQAAPIPAKAGAVPQPANTALFGDGQYSGGADKFMRAPDPNAGDANFTGRPAGTQGFRHDGRSNVAFCDGHAESWSASFTNNADGASVAPGTGFLSRDNSRYGSTP